MTNNKLNKIGHKSYLLEIFHNLSSIFLITVAYYCLLTIDIQEVFIFTTLATVMVAHYLTSRFFFGIPLSLKDKLGESPKGIPLSLKVKHDTSPIIVGNACERKYVQEIQQYLQNDVKGLKDCVDDKEESRQSGDDK